MQNPGLFSQPPPAWPLMISEAGDTVLSLFRAHLERYDILNHSDNSKVVRRSRRMEKVTERLRRLKNTQRKMRRRDKPSFNNVLRAHNKAKKLCDQLATDSRLRYHENSLGSQAFPFARNCARPPHNQNAHNYARNREDLGTEATMRRPSDPTPDTTPRKSAQTARINLP